MLPIPQCLTLAIVITTIVVKKLDCLNKNPFDLDL